MANITLKQLRYFEALARHGHFGRAAEASSISQPALSTQIRELEANLGVLLFERGPRQVRLTPFGEDFAIRVRDILQRVDELDDLARIAQGGLSGRLRIGVIPTVAPYLVTTMIASLTGAWPGLDVHVRETMTPRLIDEIARGSLDTAIVALPVSEPALVETPLFTEPFVLVRPEAERGRPMPERERLHEMRLLLLEEGHCFRDQALSFCDMPAAAGRHGLDASTLSTLVRMVGAGIGVTLLPEMAVAAETRGAPVVVGRFPAPEPERTLGLVWRRTTPLAAQLQRVAEVLGAAMGARGRAET
ncbi:hydrogen peroxide-inducible genes activator [Oceaniglobus roseus]|uniref:hydrogen peroxide-inducible genes activator n=1 Tax=Oceaniglobus roseus TaxID=1737570 RepID=UPI000C7E86CF|nr:hydrogen peroxide-inducible genes activator [Kandeliimicrobium roseum]